MAPTPEAPKNTFDGHEQSVDAQKAALTQLLAEQGGLGAQSIQNRAADAAAIQGQAQQQFGVGGGYPYQTFGRDAEQAALNQKQHMERLAAANAAYMDQVKAASPLQRGDVDAMYGAMRMEYEERQREREAEERRRQEEHQMRMAQTRAANSQSSSMSMLQKALEGRAVDQQLAQMDFANLQAGQKTPSLARQAGASGQPRDILQAAKDLGMDVNAAKRRWVDKDQKSQFAAQDRALMEQIKVGIQQALAEDAPWSAVIASGHELAANLGLDYTANIQPWLAVYSPLWGVTDAEWATLIPKGPGYNYKPPASSKPPVVRRPTGK